MTRSEPPSLFGNPIATALRYPRYGYNLARRVLGHDRRSWYYFAILFQEGQNHRKIGPPVNYYEFGVGWGESLSLYITALKDACATLGARTSDYNLFLFDSFKGLPPSVDSRDLNPAFWNPGSFACSVLEIQKIIRKAGLDPQSKSIRFFEGKYEESLTGELRNLLATTPPGIVTIDCDYYSSTRTVLDWLRPILSTGCLLYFDDIWSFSGNPRYGELGAINDFNSEDDGHLTPIMSFPLDGPLGRVFIYSRKSFEYQDLERRIAKTPNAASEGA